MNTNGIEQRLCNLIQSKADVLLGQLGAHIAIPTGCNHAPGLDNYRRHIIDRLKALGAEIKLTPGTPAPQWLTLPNHTEATVSISPTLLAMRRGKTPTPRVLLAGHLDTVHDPAGSFRELTISTGSAIATGPGAVDMKGGIVIALNALEALTECGVDLSWTFLLNSDEETGSFHSFEAIANAAAEHDIGIALEPALPDGSLVVERMGSGQFKIEVFGRSAHAGRDFARGISAVNTLGELLVELAAMSDPQRGMIVNVGPLQGGAVTNAVPDYAACWGNLRFADSDAAEVLGRKLDGLATKDDGLPRIVVHRLFNRPAKPLTPGTQQFAEAIQSVGHDLGQTFGLGKTGGVCDGNIMQAAGLPTIDTLGVCGGNLHRPDEFIEIPSLVDRCQLLAVVLARIAAGTIQIRK